MLSIIIPVHNQHEMTVACIDAVKRNTCDYELVIVDNGSEPPIQGAAVRNAGNQGFPKAVNQGVAAAKGDTIILLNNDVIVTKGWSEKLTAALDDFAVVGPVTNYTAGLQRVSIDVYEDEDELERSAARYAEAVGIRTREVTFLIGFCMAFKKSLWDRIGAFDDSLWPCSGEEIDFCLRAHNQGLRVGIVMDCYVHHEGSQTFKIMDVDYDEICKRNDRHLADRWGDGLWARQAVHRNGLRLNLGCGGSYLDGFVNVDQNKDVNPDVVSDAMALPFGYETVDEINAGHLLEHFDWVDGDKLLRHWHGMLRTGGKVFVTVPDYDMLVNRYVQDPSPEHLRELNDLYIYSYKQKSLHKYAYSAALLRQKMEDCGFTGLKKMPFDHAYFAAPVDWQCGVEGVKA